MYGTSASTLEAKVVILGSQGNYMNLSGQHVKLSFCFIKGVGKTSIVVRYINKIFSPNSTSTIGASFMTKKL
jgi:Ras-related protein Rab-21